MHESPTDRTVADANEAVARVAHALSDVIAIYPITPSSPMAELADSLSASGTPNVWGIVPEVIEMQSEAGVAGVLHGAVTTGALATTFTASQGLLLMVPNMFKIAGELTPAVIHVAARTVATHALSIFGDHSDVMATRMTGWAMLASPSVQEAQDLALIAHAATLEARVPFLHFFDGFRTSHELATIVGLAEGEIAAVLDPDAVAAHRRRGLSPDRPVLRGSAQNPDVFFQAREASNPFYDAVPKVVWEVMQRFARVTGRRYDLFHYAGAPDADRVVVLMGSGAGAVEEAVDELVRRGERVGVLTIRLFRPFPGPEVAAALPATVRRVAVLDRTKEPGALGEPLYQDVVAALAEYWDKERGHAPAVSGGRYGLSSKEFTPAMAAAVFTELARERPARHFTVGINDDVTQLSLAVDRSFRIPVRGTSAVLYGLGSDGTVSSAKSSVKIVGEKTGLHVQGYVVYDSKKAGQVTVSHLRFSPEPIRSTYLVDEADLVACHQFGFLRRLDVLAAARPGATFLLNSPYPASEVWGRLPLEVQRQIVERGLRFFVVDGYRIAREAGLGIRINTVLQACFFAVTGILPLGEAIEAIKDSVRETYGKAGEEVVARNLAAIDAAPGALEEVAVPADGPAGEPRGPTVPPEAPEFVQRVTASILAGRGDLLPVSAFPPDGTFPTGTARWEKRQLATQIPIWDPEICIDCAKCVLVCPHAALRMKVYEPRAAEGAPPGFRSKQWKGKDLPGHLMTIQVAPDDCTGCTLCVDACPVEDKATPGRKSIAMEPAGKHRDEERESFAFFLGLRRPTGQRSTPQR
jgi:pyruvate-ferredoxin/flavodoxin oxidoreductase